MGTQKPQIILTKTFEKEFLKHDNSIIKEANKRIERIISDPEIGRPLRYCLKGERELYVGHFRLIYSYSNNTITFLKFRHKDEAGNK